MTADLPAAPTEPTAQASTTGLGGRLRRVVMLSSLSTAILRLGQFLVGIMIAHLVSPTEFGTFVVAITIYVIVINFSTVGVGSALIREVDNGDRIGPTVAAIAWLTSGSLAALLFLLAPVLSSLLGAPDATPAVRVLAIPLLLAGPTAVPSAQLTRDLRQGRRFVADLANFMVGNGVLLWLALDGHGVMALAWSRVAGQAVSAVILIASAPTWYWPRLERSEAARLLRFGLPLAGSDFAGYVLANLDFIVIARLAGTDQLGFYNMAFNIASWPVSIFSAVLLTVTIPVLARVRGGPAELNRHINVALAAVWTGSLLVTSLCLVLAHPLIVQLYGVRWAPAAAALMVLVVFGLLRTVVSLGTDVLIAMDRTRPLMRINLIWLAVLTPAMFLGVHLGGSVGAGWAHVAVMALVTIPLFVRACRRAAQLKLGTLARTTVRPVVAGAAAALAAFLVTLVIDNGWAQLIVGGLVGGGVYLAVLGRYVVRLRNELRSLYGRRAAAGDEPAAPAGLPVPPEVEIARSG